jgi:hypothetical protein
MQKDDVSSFNPLTLTHEIVRGLTIKPAPPYPQRLVAEERHRREIGGQDNQ